MCVDAERHLRSLVGSLRGAGCGRGGAAGAVHGAAGTSWTPGTAGLLGCLASFGQEEMGELL